MLKSAIIVLAMSGSKQLLEFQGKPLVRHAADAACGSGCSPVVVVLGAWAKEMRAALDGLRVEVVVNRRWVE
ncbi:MAG: NTP transferase domain-containing protein, partial [Bryobacteraceae bacterium]